MQIFGVTRRGSLIWVDVEKNEKGELVYRFPIYADNEDNFDAWVVLDFLSVRFRRKNERQDLIKAIAGSEYFEEEFEARAQEHPQTRMTFSERVALAKSLLDVAYRVE